MSDPSDPSTPDQTPPDRSGFRLPGPSVAGALAWIHLGWKTRIKIDSMKLLKLTFRTDHQVMTNNNSDWEDTGAMFYKPDWTFGNASSPISHSLNRNVIVELDFEVNPPTADETTGDVTGNAAFGSLVFTATKQTFKGGIATITAESGPLPNQVGVLTGDIHWSVNTKDKNCDAGASWGHTIYVTYAKPSGSSVTQKRVVWVTNAAKGKSSQQDCVNAIFDAMMQYTYALGSVPPDPTWKIYGGAPAECGILADQFKLACLMLGLPDNFTKGFVYPLVTVDGAKFSESAADNETRTLTGTHQAQHGAVEPMGFQDHNGGNNNYEGCIQYGSVYYCIGEDRYTSPEAVMKDMVVLTFWIARGGSICKDPGPFPIATW
jgi:hypothetical protein